jgi:AcrR family transcriptional regulator
MEKQVRRRLPPERRREELLSAALSLAAGGDVSAISVEELAAHAGVSEGLLYHYFPTKQALVVAAVRRAADQFLEEIRAAASGPPLEQLTSGLAAYLDHVQAQPTGWKALLRADSGDLADIGQQIESESLGLVLLALGVADPSPVLLAALSGWAAFERSACLVWLDHPEISRTAVEELLQSTFLAALESAAHHDPVTAAVVGRIGESM